MILLQTYKFQTNKLYHNNKFIVFDLFNLLFISIIFTFLNVLLFQVEKDIYIDQIIK